MSSKHQTCSILTGSLTIANNDVFYKNYLDFSDKPKCEQRNTSFDQKTTSLFCPVKSLPNPVKYFWRFENQTEKALNENILISEENFLSLDHLLKALEKNYMDEILISCWATNEVGEQKFPCLLYVKHNFRKPTAPKDCVVNASANALFVQCLTGNIIGQHLLINTYYHLLYFINTETVIPRTIRP